MVEDVLRFKRLDGVSAALEAIAGAWFGGGRQQWIVTDSPGVPTQVIWGREDQIIPVAQAVSLTGVAVPVVSSSHWQTMGAVPPNRAAEILYDSAMPV